MQVIVAYSMILQEGGLQSYPIIFMQNFDQLMD